MIGILKNEKICTQYGDGNGNVIFMVTVNVPISDTYYLYEVIDGKCTNTKHKNKDPTELEKWVYK